MATGRVDMQLIVAFNRVVGLADERFWRPGGALDAVEAQGGSASVTLITKSVACWEHIRGWVAGAKWAGLTPPFGFIELQKPRLKVWDLGRLISTSGRGASGKQALIGPE